MLLNNYSWLNSNPGRAIGGFTNLHQNFKPGSMMNFFDQEKIDSNESDRKTASLPTGTEPPYSFDLALKGGELSSLTFASGESSLSAYLSSGKTMTASLSGIGALTADLSITASIVANLVGTGSLSVNMSATLSIAANLVGSGNIAAALKLLVPLAGNLNGIGSATANLKGNADIAAIIYVNQSEATVKQLVDGVWNAEATEYNLSGTMGQKLNGAGSAGDPWTTDLSSYTTEGTAGKKLKDALTEDNFLALK